ncbi:MAG: protein translocase subunit SecD [Candidatus Harrisonbacteria bacterium]|nr:protein translocase subunit SecD [Candidatus Harrisonbacteria bacterium]
MKGKALSLIMIVLALTVLAGFFIAPSESEMKPWRLGLDLVGGSHLVYEVNMSEVADADRDLVHNGLRDVIERRVNAFGVSEPNIVTAKSGDSYRIIAELAGIQDVSEAIRLIGETPVLVFAELDAQKMEEQLNEGTLDLENLAEQFIPTELTGRFVRSAQLTFDNISGQPIVSLIFDDEGAALFEAITERNVGQQVAIFLDGEIISAPVVQQVITGGQAQITGLGDINEARLLVERLNAGALPAPIELISQQTVGASLGAGSLRSIIWAGIVGTFLVILFMLIYYRGLGLYASLALIIYIILLLALFKLFFTLTLATIAGIVLSIGMAIDANILIFERTKEELLKGAKKIVAVTEGFRRAWPSIRDSNVTTIITSLVLYNLTSSFIRGFALSLLLGVIISMFTAITVTRNLLILFSKEK